jgi:hypothetical protein
MAHVRVRSKGEVTAGRCHDRFAPDSRYTRSEPQITQPRYGRRALVQSHLQSAKSSSICGHRMHRWL